MLRAGLRQLAEALADSLPSSPPPAPEEKIPEEKIDILLDVFLRRWILERYPGHPVAWFFLLWERHREDIARGLQPFWPRLIETGIFEPRASLQELAGDFLGPLVEHLSENDWGRLRRWDPLRGPMGPWLRKVVWQRALDLLRARYPEIRLEDEAGEGAEELPWEERVEDRSATLPWEEVENQLDAELFLKKIRQGLEERDWYILYAAFVEGWSDEEIAEILRVRRETVNRRKRRALRQAFCALWKEWVRGEDLPDPRIAQVVAEYGAGRSEEEIARGLDLPVEDVKALREEALRILRRALGR